MTTYSDPLIQRRDDTAEQLSPQLGDVLWFAMNDDEWWPEVERVIAVSYMAGETLTGNFSKASYIEETNDHAEEYARSQAAQLVTSLSQAQRESVQQIVASAFINGTPDQIIAQRINKVVGLDLPGTNAVNSLFDNLTSSGMPTGRAHQRAMAYADQLRYQRAQTIARTEVASALNHGLLKAWEDGIDNYDLDQSASKKWVLHPSERTCPTCVGLEGEVVPVKDVFDSQWESPPVHPNCACTMKLVTPDGIAKSFEKSDQEIDKGWKDAWKYELRNKFGEWTVNTEILSARRVKELHAEMLAQGYTEDQARNNIDDNAGMHMAVARNANNKIVGQLTYLPPHKSESNVSLQSFKALEPGKGVGTALMRHVAQFAERVDKGMAGYAAVPTATTYYQKMGANFYPSRVNTSDSPWRWGGYQDWDKKAVHALAIGQPIDKREPIERAVERRKWDSGEYGYGRGPKEGRIPAPWEVSKSYNPSELRKPKGPGGGRWARLFHGTGDTIAVGDNIISPAAQGRVGIGAQTGAFASPELREAVRYVKGDTPHVYEVEPVDPSDNISHVGTQGQTEVGSKTGFKVVREVPPPEGGWYQRFMESDSQYDRRIYLHRKSLSKGRRKLPHHLQKAEAWRTELRKPHGPEGGRWVHSPITEFEARGDSARVTADQFQDLAEEGRKKLADLRDTRPTTALNDPKKWAAIKQHAYQSVQRRWDGDTIDPATGEALQLHDHFAVTVKKPGQESISVPIDASPDELGKAMDEAKVRFADQLQGRLIHLGVFRDDDEDRIDIDPTAIVESVHDADTMGAFTHAVGGAYDFATTTGHFPPHVAAENTLAPISGVAKKRSVSADLVMRQLPQDIQDRINKTVAKYMRVTPEEAVKNVYDMVMGMTSAEREKASKWYFEANAFNHAVAEQNNMNFLVVSAITACLSPGQTWETSNKSGTEILTHMYSSLTETTPIDQEAMKAANALISKSAKKSPLIKLDQTLGQVLFGNPRTAAIYIAKAAKLPISTYDSFEKAVRLAQKDDPSTIDTILNGPKVRSFFNNMVNPTGPLDVTIDRHMMRVFVNGLVDTAEGWDRIRSVHKHSTPVTTVPKYNNAAVGVYPAMAEVMRQVTALINQKLGTHYTISQIQAMAWVKQKKRFPGRSIRKVLKPGAVP